MNPILAGILGAFTFIGGIVVLVILVYLLCKLFAWMFNTDKETVFVVGMLLCILAIIIRAGAIAGIKVWSNT
jgi:hypothetical protein